MDFFRGEEKAALHDIAKVICVVLVGPVKACLPLTGGEKEATMAKLEGFTGGKMWLWRKRADVALWRCSGALTAKRGGSPVANLGPGGLASSSIGLEAVAQDVTGTIGSTDVMEAVVEILHWAHP